jgi:predicted Zn-dependent protease
MAEAGQDRKLRMRSLGHFAAFMAVEVGDLNAARRYCEELLTDSPDDTMALYALADSLARQGETDEAKRRAAECRRAAFSQGEPAGKLMVELLEKRFPDLKSEP